MSYIQILPMCAWLPTSSWSRMRPCAVDGHVVEHVAGLGAVEQALDGAAEFGVGDVGEAEAVEPAAADLGADAVLDLVVAVGGDEVVVAGVVRVPLAVFGRRNWVAPLLSLSASSWAKVRPETSPSMPLLTSWKDGALGR